MQVKPIVRKNQFLLFVSIAASSIFLELPSYGATFKSEGLLAIEGFSKTPQLILTDVDDDKFVKAKDDSIAIANTFANPFFLIDPSSSLECSSSLFTQTLPAPAACNPSSSDVEVGGVDYIVRSRIESSVIGGFAIASGETFSFDFTALLSLETDTADLNARSFGTFGSLSLELYSVSGSNFNLLDSFLVSGNINSRGSSDFLESSRTSDNITLTDSDSLTDFGDDSETAIAIVQGSYSRVFDEDTQLVLVGTNVNQVTTIPESSNLFALLSLPFWGAIAFGWRFKKNESKL